MRLLGRRGFASFLGIQEGNTQLVVVCNVLVQGERQQEDARQLKQSTDTPWVPTIRCSYASKCVQAMRCNPAPFSF
jgi:NADH:ubiquinone oxidoreductase subunit F (NADH-binding)